MSLSARRAWIEICRNRFCPTCQWVALRKESVDRNINSMILTQRFCAVALRKESVDRNEEDIILEEQTERRSPQGERG